MLSMADQVRGIALEGLKYAKDPYDKARYERLLEIAATQFAKAVEHTDYQWIDEGADLQWHPGHDRRASANSASSASESLRLRAAFRQKAA